MTFSPEARERLTRMLTQERDLSKLRDCVLDHSHYDNAAALEEALRLLETP